MCAVMMDHCDDIRDVKVRRNVALLDRRTLEDKYFGLMEETLLLKKHSRLQEDKMRKMATKLLKLSSNSKEKGNLARDIETEEMIEGLHSRIRSLEMDNTSLRNKVMVLKLQSETSKRKGLYDHIPPRINTGNKKKPMATANPVHSEVHSVGTQVSMATQPHYGHSLLKDARKDNLYLEDLVLDLKRQIDCLEAQLEEEKVEFAGREKKLVQENEELQKKLLSVVEELQQSAISEDIDKIRLVRELKEKSSSVVSLQTQVKALERQLSTVQKQNVHLLEEMERVNVEVKEEVSTKVKHGGLCSDSQVANKAFIELKEMVADLRHEKNLLKSANERLLKSSLDDSKGRSFQREIQNLQERVFYLEGQVKVEESQKNRYTEKLALEKLTSEKLRSDLNQLQTDFFAVQGDYMELQRKIEIVTQKGELPWECVEEAVDHFKVHKEKGLSPAKSYVEQAPVQRSDVTQFMMSSQASVVRTLRNELENRVSQVNELKERLTFYENLVAKHEAEIDQLKLEVTAVHCSLPQSQNASVQTLLVGMVPRCSQTDRVCTQSVASQIRVEVDEVSVQTDPAMETNKKEDFGNVNETVQSENKDPFSEESFDTPTGTPTLSPVSESENHVSSEEDVVMDCFAQSHKTTASHTLAISILSLTVYPESSVAKNPKIARLFVEYEFLNFDISDLETPMSLWKPTNGQNMIFNFRQVFSFHPTLDVESREDLKSAIDSTDECSGQITFIVVCEPEFEDKETECFEVGIASLNIKQVFTDQQDLIGKQLPVRGVGSAAEEVIGLLEISLEALAVLNNL